MCVWDGSDFLLQEILRFFLFHCVEYRTNHGSELRVKILVTYSMKKERCR